MDQAQQPKKETRVIETETVNAVLQYLSGRPYIEVMKVVPLLLNLPVLKEEDKAATPPPVTE